MKKIFTLCAALFVAVMCFAQAQPITVDLSQMQLDPSSPHQTGNWNGEQLDYFQTGDIANIPLVNPAESAYKISFSYATILTDFEVTIEIYGEDGVTKYTEEIALPVTTPTGTENDWSYWKDITATNATPVLPAGNYTISIKYGEGLWDGAPNNFGANIKNMVLTPEAGGTPSTPDTPSDSGSEVTADKLVGTISNTTVNAEACDGASWTFVNGEDLYFVSNSNGSKNFSTAGDYVKFSRKLDFTIEIPENVIATAVEFIGYTNASWADGSYSYISKFNGEFIDAHNDDKTSDFIKNRQAKYGFPGSDEKNDDDTQKLATHKIAIANPTAGAKIPFYIGGTNQICAIINVYAADATGIESIVSSIKVLDGAIYNLSGQKVGNDYKGIVIKNGRKYLMK